ncbi:hypothetical protein REPUB_Repub12eG0102000 [Reevesia pubescens]
MRHNGIEETTCTMRIKQNMENEADFVSRQAGRINIVHQQKLPILQFIDTSAERGYLKPKAIHTPIWSMTEHRVVYVTNGEAQVQIVDNTGEAIMDESKER